MKGVTPQYPSGRQQGTPKKAVFLNRLTGIGRTGRVIPARRRQMGGNRTAVKPDQNQRYPFHQ
jgi:hypothetical protein